MTTNPQNYAGVHPLTEIEPALLQRRLKAGEDIQLIDVREGYEHDTFNIGGVLMPMGDVINRRGEIPKNKPVVLYCRKGVRSAIIIQRLQDKYGFENLINLKGGVENWFLQVHA
jgi:rhodanese-related sulfurtransferase